MRRHRRSKRRKLRAGVLTRATQCQDGRNRGQAGRLLPHFAEPPTEAPVDPQRLAAEIAALTRIGHRRGAI